FCHIDAGTYRNLANSPQVIPDAGTAESVLLAPASAGIIRRLSIELSIFHTFDADLDITLTHVPSGTSVVLFTDVGNNDDGFIIQLRDGFTDIGTVADSPTDQVVSGTFKPEGTASLSAFKGLDASGEWRLIITDDTAGNTGVLTAWSLLV